MRCANLADPPLTYDDDPDGFHAGMFRFGPRLGAEQTGASLYVLPPGQAVCPHHYEHAEPARVLMWSTVVCPAVTVYPDSDEVGVWTQSKVDDAIVERSSHVDHFLGETPDH